MAKIKIDSNLYDKAKKAAEEKGYSSVEEFIIHTLQTAVENTGDGSNDDQQVADQLRGLGYIE